jgi:hypothetical protein
MTMKAIAFLAAMIPLATSAADCTVRSGDTTNALVELYTSEGCSSCPPAEKWLSRFAGKAGSGVVPVAFHVHYWDYIGWKDVYADPRNTERQKKFALATGARSVYTPQVIVAGNDFRLWSSDRAFEEAVRAVNASKAAATIEIAPRRLADGSVEGNASAAVSERAKANNLTLVVALTQDGITSKPNAGENKGETLPQNFVVRDVAEFRGNGAIAGNFRFSPKPGWNPERMSVVAYVQDPATGRVLQSLRAPVCRG